VIKRRASFHTKLESFCTVFFGRSRPISCKIFGWSTLLCGLLRFCKLSKEKQKIKCSSIMCRVSVSLDKCVNSAFYTRVFSPRNQFLPGERIFMNKANQLTKSCMKWFTDRYQFPRSHSSFTARSCRFSLVVITPKLEACFTFLLFSLLPLIFDVIGTVQVKPLLCNTNCVDHCHCKRVNPMFSKPPFFRLYLLPSTENMHPV